MSPLPSPLKSPGIGAYLPFTCKCAPTENTELPCEPTLLASISTDTPPVPPRLSVTTSDTVYWPAAAYVWLTVSPEPLVPSPKFHWYVMIDPSGSLEPDAFIEQLWLLQPHVNAAFGNTLLGPLFGTLTLPLNSDVSWTEFVVVAVIT